MKFKIANLAWMGGFALAAFGLYLVKYSVQDVQQEVSQLQAQLRHENESIHLLNAEWAYLNRPERLQKLAQAHVAVQPLSSVQILDVQRLPVLVAETHAENGGELLHTVSGMVPTAGSR